MNPTESETIVLTREELFERVWTTAMRNLAPQLGISDVGLKKVCKRFDIPTPPVGYWAKKEHGKAPKRPKLPAHDDPDLEGIKFYPGNKPIGAGEPDPLDAIAQREKERENRIVVPDTFDAPHPLVERTLKSLKAARPDQQGLVRPRAKMTLDLHVAPESIDRAARVMDAVMKALEHRSLPVQLVPEGDRRATSVTVIEEHILIGLYEDIRREEREPTQAEQRRMKEWPRFHGDDRFYREVPTGELYLLIRSGPASGRRHRFGDTQRRRIESLLNSFIVALYRTAHDIKAERVRQELQRLEQEERARRRQEFERQRYQKLQEIRAEEECVSGLLKQAEAWNQSQSLRRFVEAAHDMFLDRDGDITPGGEPDKWLNWASQQADRLDPLVESPPSILDEKPKWERHSYW